MILTIALSPSVEKSIRLDELNIGEENHISHHNLMIGDSAVYSAYIIKLLQGEPYLIGFAGGIGGRYIKYFTDRNRIKSDFLWKEQESRYITNIIDKNNQITRLINPGFKYTEQDLKNFKLKFNSHTKDIYGVIINNDVDNDYTREMLEVSLKFSQKNQLKTILSLSGEQLRHALHYKPYAIVVNEEDLRMLNIYFEDEIAQVGALREMILNDKIHMLFYRYAGQLYAVTKNKIAKVVFGKAVSDDKRLKDVLTGVLGVCVSRKYEMEKTLRLMGAVMDVADFESYPKVCTRKEVMTRRGKVSLIEIYNQRNGYIV